MNFRAFTGGSAALLAAVAVASAIPAEAQAGSLMDRLRAHGLGSIVDRYVSEDANGDLNLKSDSTSSLGETSSVGDMMDRYGIGSSKKKKSVASVAPPAFPGAGAP